MKYQIRLINPSGKIEIECFRNLWNSTQTVLNKYQPWLSKGYSITISQFGD